MNTRLPFCAIAAPAAIASDTSTAAIQARNRFKPARCFEAATALVRAVGLAAFLAVPHSAHSAALTWDTTPGDGATITAGSGAWDTTGGNLVWNDGATPNVAWSQTDTTHALNSAIFAGADAAANTYTVTLGSQMAASALTFNSSGYNLTGSTVYLGAGATTVAAGKTNTVNSVITFTTSILTVGSGGRLTLSGGGSFWGVNANVSEGAAGTVQLTSGTAKTYTISPANVNINLGSPANPGSGLFVGDNSTLITGSGSASIGRGATSMVTINGVNAVFNANAATTGFIVGTGAAAKLVLQAGTVSYSATAGMIIGGSGANSNGELDVWGGTVTTTVLGCGQNSVTTGLIIITNGVVNAGTFRFDYGGTPGTGSGTLRMSGGSLYVGSGGITNNNGAGTFTYAINLSGGTVGASTNWSSSLNMVLTNDTGTGYATFQAADTNNAAQNIALPGVLSGTGGLIKTGGGVLTLSGASTYTGNTTNTAGVLMLTGGGGALAGSPAITISSGATLAISNTASANNTDRLGNSATITLNGGTFSYLNEGSAASFSETAGALVMGAGASTVNVNPAISGQTSALTFASLSVGGGATVNFVGTGIGTSVNRIFFTSTPGSLAGVTVNGFPAAYNGTDGLHAAVVTYTDIAATGDTVPDGAGNYVRINSAGSGGNDQLAATTTSVTLLLQNVTTACVLDADGKTLRVGTLQISNNMAALTIGTYANSGTLTALAAGGALALQNDSANSNLTINAVIADNTSASGLTKRGSGRVILTAINTYSGATLISQGTLALSGSASLSSPTITVAANANFDVSGLASTLMTGSGQTLVGTGTSGSGTIHGSGSAGLTLGGSAALQLSFIPGTPTFTVTGGAFTLGAGNLVTVNISNGGTPLGLGSYKLIGSGAGGSVVGTVPLSLTVTGDSVTGGSPYLWISGGALYLVVVSPALTWDANTSSSGAQDGSGVWNGITTNWWDASASSDVSGNWGPVRTCSATFGAGSDGNYVIDLGDNSLNASNLTFVNAGYTLTNGALTLPATAFNLNAAANATINVPLTNASPKINASVTLTVGGGGTFTGVAQGGTQGPGTLQLTAGTAKNYTLPGPNQNINLGSPTDPTTGLIVGDNSTVITAAGTISIGRGANGMATINGVNALLDASAANTGFIIGTTGAGRLILQAGSVNYNGLAGLLVGGSGGGNGELDVWGGTVTASVLGCGQNTSTTGLISITNGVVNAGTFRFDYGGTPGSGSGTLQMSGGSLYVGSGGITNNNGAGTFTYAINLSGGTVGANANWSSSLDMNLGTDNGDITFRAADTNDTAQNIVLSGSLSGLGGLIKTGSGTLLLNGYNYYGGTTLVSAGALGGTGVIGGPVVVTAAGTLAPGASIGTLTINNNLTISGNLFVEVDRTASPSSDYVNVSGALTNAGTGTVMVTNLGTSVLAVGDSFTLFNQVLVNGDALTVIGAGAIWTNKLAYDGSIEVVSLLAPPNFSPGGTARLPDGNISLTATGGLGAVYKLWASPDVALTPITTTWTLLSSGTVTTSPFTLTDLNATNYPQRFYLFSAP